MAINPLHQPPTSTSVSKPDGQVTYDWNRFFDNTYTTVNDLVSAANGDSLLLNGNFHYNNGVSSSVTELDGDGTDVSETWQIFGASNSDYTAGYEDYMLEDE